MKLEMNLQYFVDTTYTLTLYKDAGITTFTASPDSGAKDTEVTLTITPASGYELDEIEVIAGGVTVNMTTKKFTIGEANVVLYAKSKANNKYKVVESVDVNINGSKTPLTRNMKIVTGATGAIIDVQSDGTAITLGSEIIAQLVKDGIIVKI